MSEISAIFGYFKSDKMSFDIAETAESHNFQFGMFYCILMQYLEYYLPIKLPENSNFIYAKLTFEVCTLLRLGPY